MNANLLIESGLLLIGVLLHGFRNGFHQFHRSQAPTSARLVLKQVKNIFLKSPRTFCKAHCSSSNYKIDIAQDTLKNKAYGYGSAGIKALFGES